MDVQRSVFARLYRRAPSVESLPWHRDEVPGPLVEAVEQRAAPGRALDLGCGQGVAAVHLAQQGYSVVGVDFVAGALTAAGERAERAGVELELVEADVLAYEATAAFDVVVDSGCLHHLSRRSVDRYRRRLDRWLAPGGDYVLVHFAHRGRIPMPGGPRALTLDEAVDLFSPFELRAHDEISFDVPLPMGRMRAGAYWFHRPA